MRCQPKSYVGLAAYHASLLSHGKHHDLYWDDFVQVFNGFHIFDDNEFDKIYSMVIFARTSDGIIVDGAHDKSARSGSQSNKALSDLVEFRPNFAESWL